jgi:hypothetical protein
LLERKQLENEVFRIGRRPDPWRPQDWSRANPDGTFGNRFDEPGGNYRVLYAASQELSCYIETIARFRSNFELLAAVKLFDSMTTWGFKQCDGPVIFSKPEIDRRIGNDKR